LVRTLGSPLSTIPEIGCLISTLSKVLGNSLGRSSSFQVLGSGPFPFKFLSGSPEGNIHLGLSLETFPEVIVPTPGAALRPSFVSLLASFLRKGFRCDSPCSKRPPGGGFLEKRFAFPSLTSPPKSMGINLGFLSQDLSLFD